jgi:hypothetical protein
MTNPEIIKLEERITTLEKFMNYEFRVFLTTATTAATVIVCFKIVCESINYSTIVMASSGYYSCPQTHDQF